MAQIKIAYITDTSLKTQNPESRLDNYETAILAKFVETGQIARAEGCDVVVHGGDMFDIPHISDRLSGLLGEIIHDWGIRTLAVPGNHDMYGYNVKTIYNTTFGTLVKHRVFEMLTRDRSVILEKDGLQVSLQGQEFFEAIDRDPNNYRVEMTSARWHVLVPHGMLLPKAAHPDMEWTSLDAVPPGADLVLCSHWHPGFDDYVNANGTLFINKGSMGRDEASADAKIRIPGVVIVTLDDTRIDHKFIPLTCAKPGPEVLDFTTNQQKKLKKNYLANFKATLNQAASFKALDVMQILQQKAGAMGLLTQALAGIQEAEALVDSLKQKLDGYVDKGYSTYITDLEIENWQSHKDTKVSLSPGTNAFTGRSNSGKTTLAVRVIKWIVDDEPSGSDFIRTGENKCWAKMTFSDGTWIERERTRGAAGMIKVFDGNQVHEFKGFKNKIPPDVANVHQMPSIQLTKDLRINLNISEQLSAPFLLSESPGNRAIILGNLTGVNVIDAAIKETNRKILALSKETTIKEASITEKQGRMTQYDDLPTMELQMLQADMGLKIVAQDEADIADIEDLLKERAVLSSDAQILQAKKAKTAKVDIALATVFLAKAEDAQAEVDKITELIDTAQDIEDQRARLKERRDSCPDVTKAPAYLDMIAALDAEIAELGGFIILAQDIAQSKDTLKANQAAVVQRFTEASEKYRKELEALKVCPICLSVIDDARIDTILDSVGGTHEHRC